MSKERNEESFALNDMEYDKIVKFSDYVSIPDEQPIGQIAVGCKGCEGGCAAEICAK